MAFRLAIWISEPFRLTHLCSPRDTDSNLHAFRNRQVKGYPARKTRGASPFSVYLGWITVASIADVAATLVSYNWNGFGISPSTWAILVVAVALVITMLMLATRKDIAYSLVIIWALIGIGVNHTGNQSVVTLIEVASALVAVALVATVLVSNLPRK